mgnify:FL=1|tara:strand:- start:2400 stop:2990 length:591 start_codon:yes stop_codon:yes gene_type:complete
MKSMKGFIVKLPKKTKDSVTLAGGVEIFMDTKYDEFRHRVMDGEVVALPAKHDTDIKVGDTIYFHHHVVVQGGTPLPGYEGCYTVMFHPTSAMDSQAFAHKCAETGVVKSLSSWCLLEFVEENHIDDLESDTIKLVELTKKGPTKGRIAFASIECEAMGVGPGDIVGIDKNRDYRVVVDGKDYYRTRSDDFMYVEN